MKPLYLSTLIVGLALAPCAMAYQANKTYRFTVLHTNDTHGRFWQNEHGEYGFPAQKTLIDQIKKQVKKQGGSVIVLHAGDVNTGVPESDIQNARPDIEAMNKMGYEAMTLGNHEFDNPLQILDMQEKWAKFPFLSANVVDKTTGKRLVKPYTVLNKNGLKIAVVGLTTEETATVGNPMYVKNLTFQPVIKSAKKTLANIKRKHRVDVRIALTHLGYSHATRATAATSDVQLAEKLPKNTFDLIVGGHSHTIVCMNADGTLNTQYQAGETCKPDYRNGTWIVQAGEWGKYVGRADFVFKNGKTKLVNYQLIPINLKKKVKDNTGKEQRQLYQAEIPADAKLKALLQKYQDQGTEKLAIPLTQSQGAFDGSREVSRTQQTALGRLITRAQKERVNADLAVTNGGSIRASLPSGTISYKDVLTVQPFGNTVNYVDFTGSELQHYLQTVRQFAQDTGSYAQFSSDVQFQDNAILIQGKPIVANQTYRLAINNFIGAGGDGYPNISKHPKYVESGFVDADILKAFLQQKPSINPADFAPK